MSHNLAPSQDHEAPRLTPLQVVERLIGPPEEIGPTVGYGTKAAYHWRHPRTGRTAGDLPSAEVMRRLLAHSEAHRRGLTAEHLIRGATEAEVQEILSGLGTPAVPRFASRRAAAASPLQAAE